MSSIVIFRDTIVFEREFEGDKTEEAERHLRYLRFAYPSHSFKLTRMSDSDFAATIRGYDKLTTHPDVARLSLARK